MKHRETKPTGRRFVFEDRSLNPVEALIRRAKRLADLRAAYHALADLPLDTSECVQVEVQPDDPRYKDAPIEEVWVHYAPEPIKCNLVKKAKQ